MRTAAPLPPLPDTGWPPLRHSAEQVRARARRRTRGRSMLVAVAAATAGVVAVPAGMHAWQQVAPTQAAGPQQLGGGRWSAYGVTITLPTGWVMSPTSGSDDRRQACLSRREDPGACTLLLAVSARPHGPLDERLDPPQDVLPGCSSTDPRYLDVDRTMVGGLPATQWTGSCTRTTPTLTAWALDNFTVMLLTQYPEDADAVEAARTTFASLRIPGDWPRHGVQWAGAPSATSS